MRIVRATQQEVWPRRGEYHVLTYAEEGFAPLKLHAASTGVSRDDLASFADEVNQRLEVGSLYPRAPISAIPRSLVRSGRNSTALQAHIVEFLSANTRTFKAAKLICDFRTPSVEHFVVAAIEAAMSSVDASILEEVVILE